MFGLWEASEMGLTLVLTVIFLLNLYNLCLLCYLFLFKYFIDSLAIDTYDLVSLASFGKVYSATKGTEPKGESQSEEPLLFMNDSLRL